jgi:hypothetical protein
MFNNDVSYAYSRLVGTVMKAKNFDTGVVQVNNVNVKGSSKIIVSGYNKNMEGFVGGLEELEFNVGPLGYANTKSMGGIYLVRDPIRRLWKQGVQSRNLTFITDGELANGLSGNFCSSRDFLFSLADCLFGVYPNVGQALDFVEESGKVSAISKHFGIDSNYRLLNKSQVVGGVSDAGKLSLSKEYNYLEESLIEEAGNENVAK